MSRYIDKDILLETIEELTWYHCTQNGMVEGAKTNGWYKSDDIFKAVDALPTADVVENVRLSPVTTATEGKPIEYVKVVRCKDCMHNGSFDTDCPFGWRDERFNLPDDMDFCSYGEREEREHVDADKS